MNELARQARLLRARIKGAFADVPYPGDENLYEGWQLDDDYDDVIRNLTGKHWRDLIPKRKPPQGRRTSLSKDMTFCSAAAWHFYLPAYLISEIMRGKIDLFPFEPERSERLKGYIEGRFGRLNTEQCAVLISFFHYADALLTEKQEKTPQYANSYERERRRLSLVIDYWNDRTAARAGSEPA